MTNAERRAHPTGPAPSPSTDTTSKACLGNSTDSGDTATPYANGWQTYHQLGWPGVLPLPARRKKWPPKGFTGDDGAMPSYADLLQWAELYPAANICLRLPDGVVGIDVDNYGDKPGALTIAGAENRWGPLPTSPRSTSRADGVSGIRLYRVPPGIRFVGELGPGVEIIQRHHRYLIAWPSIHPEGRPYRWLDDDGNEIGPPRIDELPELPPEWVEGLTDHAPVERAAVNPAQARALARSGRTEGYPSARVAGRVQGTLSVLKAAGAKGTRQARTRDDVLALLRMGKQGEPGVDSALDTLRRAYVAAVADDRGGADIAAREFDRMIEPARVGPLLATPDEYERDDLESMLKLLPEERHAAERARWATATPTRPGNDDEHQGDNHDDAPQKGIHLVTASNITTEKPEWAWAHGGKGRILKAALTLFGGRPGTGKSTCARWFAAGWSTGTLTGCWEGRPVNVAYIATEEAWHHTVAPSLQAAGADMSRVHFVQDGDEPARIRSITDEATLTDLFTANDIRAVFLDPLMGTITGGADINRNNEVRNYLDPWVRIAEKINGPVVGICHMTKAPTGDVVASITGSSAFGELARCVFGFAVDRESDDGTRVMSQAKNSAGFEDLSLAYRIGSHRVRLDDGQTADMARFELIGPTDKTVRELLIAERSTHTARSGTDDCRKWLKGYLTHHGRSLREDVASAATELDFSLKMLKNAARKLNVETERTREVPSRSYWSLPGGAE